MLRLNFLTAMKRNKPLGSIASPEHYAVAEQIGNEAIVLLKNSPVAKGGNPLLPLSPALKSILVVGDNATRDLMKGGGSSELKVKDNVTPLAGLRALYGDKVKYAQGYRAGKPMYSHVEQIPASVQDSLRAEAVAMAKNADVVIMVGGLNKNHQQDCEAGDRESYALPFGQPELIEALQAANPNIIVLLLSGNAVEMPWADKVPAIAQAWYLGSMAGKSIANVVSGKVNPSGKLPFSFPVRLEDNGATQLRRYLLPRATQSIRNISKTSLSAIAGTTPRRFRPVIHSATVLAIHRLIMANLSHRPRPSAQTNLSPSLFLSETPVTAMVKRLSSSISATTRHLSYVH